MASRRTEPAGPPGPPARCAWCEAPLPEPARPGLGRIRCRACGAATTTPWPGERELSAAYGEWYRPAAGPRFSFLGDAILGRTRGLLAARIDEIAPPGPILDVGAGDGTLISALRARGRETLGLERGAVAADMSEEPIEAIEGKWAAVIFWHSLEHLPRPGDAIGEAARLLVPGGVIAVAVPDDSSLQARVFGERWLHLDLPRHLCHLNRATLRVGLEQRGFELTRSSSTRGGQIVIGWLDGLVGALPGAPSLYQALRRPGARSAPLPAPQRVIAILLGVILLPVAAVCSLVEVLARRSGTVYVEARRV